MFRSIKFLIGILILLFMLTTMGFADIALAKNCASQFEERPESREEYYSEAEVDSGFINTSSSYFYKGRTNERFESQDEFQNAESSELNYDGAF